MTRWDHHLDTLMTQRYPVLVSYARMLTGGDLAAAEDLVQDAVVKVFARSSSFTSAGHAEGYVRRTMVTLFVDATRSTTRRRRAYARVGEVGAAQGPEASVGLAADVEAALATLSPRERACVTLRFFDDLTVPQVARCLGIAEGSAKRYLADASRRLAEVLGADAALAEPAATIPVDATWSAS